MKHEIESEKLTESYSSKRIRIVGPEKYLTSLIVRQDLNIPNIFLIQNKGKGPPGRTRSPGLVDYLTRANQPAAFIEPPPERRPEFIEGLVEGNDTLNKNELLIHTKPNHYSQLNFTIMKKQVLSFVFFVLTSLFGITGAFGQVNTSAVGGSAPRGLTGCTDDALHPLPGKEYTYQSTAAPTGGLYTWWATTDPTFVKTTGTGTTNNLSTMLTTATGLISTTTNYGNADTPDNVKITWSSSLLSTTKYNTAPTFVVVQYDAGTGNCSNNLKVYQLDPMRGFTVDIRNIDVGTSSSTILAYDTDASQCTDLVRGATFNGATMEYDYGTNYFYYEVVAANFTGTYTPTFTLTGYNSTQTPTIEWSYDPPASWSGSTVWNSATTPVTTSLTNTSNGVSIYVRVTLKNNNYEGITDQTISLAVAGQDAVGYDLNNADCTAPTDVATAQADDIAKQVQKLRPTLPSTTTGSPAPNDKLIPGNEVNN